MLNEVVEYNINKNDSDLIRNYDITGINTGYELVRRLILLVEIGCWIDPLKEKWLLGEDRYPLRTVEDM